MKKKLIVVLPAIVLWFSVNSLGQQNTEWVLKGKEKTARVEPTMWGVFFEDINLGADGGIYAEMIKNRSFEFSKPLMGWKVSGPEVKEGSFLVLNESALNANNPRFLRVKAEDASPGGMGISNEGFRGMGIKAGLNYDFSMHYRQTAPGIKLLVELLDETGKPIGKGNLEPTESGKDWHKTSLQIKAGAAAVKGSFRLWITGTGEIDLDQISLFPADTWKGRKGGLRADMVQALADMKPGFIRFPGGCIVEGHELSSRYQWKKTVGPVYDRQLSINRWNAEFAHRPAPDYYQTFGLGFFEYFQMAEDIGAAPLPILNCGMACQFNTAELAPMDDLEPYIQDALDLIEFANGDANTKWGKLRADMGHPASFGLKMLGVGNENWGPQYVERLTRFKAALKAKYPEINLVYSSGTDPEGEKFEYLDKALRGIDADIIDEHYYRRPEWFLQNAARYDRYDRKGPKIFAGEYAAQSDKTVSIANRNNWQTALSEAAFMTGLERNAAVVHMASYAPLFAHTDGWQWTPDLIWVDNLKVYQTPNYYVQQLYSLNKGTTVVPILAAGAAISGRDSLYASAVLDEASGVLIIKIVNASGSEKQQEIRLDGLITIGSKAERISLQNNDLQATNAVAAPVQVKPVSSAYTLKKNKMTLDLAPYSFTVLRIPYKK